MKLKTIRLLEKNKGEYFPEPEVGRESLQKPLLKAINIKEKFDKLDLIKLKNICLSKYSIKKQKGKYKSGRKYS